MQADELRAKYTKISQEEAEAGWKEVYEASLDACMHGPYCQHGKDCQVSFQYWLLTDVADLSCAVPHTSTHQT